MTKKHKFENYTYLILNGRIKKTLKHPRRERVLVRKALSNLGVVYRELAVFRNPHYHGWKGKAEAAPQWIDFLVYYKGRLYALLFTLKRGISGIKEYERNGDDAKRKFLAEKNIPVMTLNRKDTSQIYEIRIKTFLEKEAR